MPKKKKRRIMSIDELYEFCLKNNFAHFDSNEFGKELMVRMNGNFEKTSKDEDKHKESLTPFVSRAFHDHVNLNKSEISEESFNENVPSANFRPILAHITTNSDNELDFGSHDYYVTTDKDGNDKVVYEEQPIGVIDGTKTTIEYDEDAGVNRAVLHGYLYDEYCQDAIEILNRRGTVDCSVELCIRELSFNNENKTLLLDDFYVSGLTLLSKDVSPGMAGSNFKIEDFAVTTETATFNTDNQLVKTLEKLTNILESFDIKNNPRKEETRVEMNENFDEVTETEKVTETEETTEEEVTVTENESEETVDETSEDETVDEENSEETTDESDEETEDEESTVREDNACGGGGSGTTKKKKKKNSVENEPMTKTYEISHDDIRYSLYNLLSSYEESDNDWYYITGVYDSYFVYESWNGGKIYGQKYTKDNDNVAFDGERYTLHKEYLTDFEYAELQSMRSNYASLKEFKENAEKNELHAKREEILNSEKYEAVSDTEAFKELVKNMDNYSLEELEKEAKIIFADNFNMETFAVHTEKAQKNSTVKVFANINKSKKDSRYGNLFSK